MSRQIQFRPISGLVGAEVVGPSARDLLLNSDIPALQEGLANYGVLFLRTGSLEPSLHLSFARRLGPIITPSALLATLAEEGFPDIGVISTANRLAYSSNRWHTDVTWGDCPPRYSILHMQEVPPTGGDTIWASQIAAYDALSDRMKTYLTGLTAHHTPPGNPDYSADHPVVCDHPITGRRSLFANELFTRRINELSEAESDAILQFLAAHCVRPEFTCRWTWQPGDIAIWDNHFVQHYALGDYHPASRRIHRIEIGGLPPVPAG